MSIIKIPSSNIYDIDAGGYLIPKNKFKSANISVNSFEKKFGNVLENDAIITFWKEEPSNDYGEVTFVGVSANTLNSVQYRNVEHLNNYWSAIDPISDPTGDGGFWVKIGNEFINITNDNYGKVVGFEIVIRENFVDLLKNEDDTSRYFQVQTRKKAEGLVYLSAKHAFSIPFDERVLIGVDGKLDGDTDIKWRLLNRTISIEGEYFSPLKKTESYPQNVTPSNGSIKLPTNELCQDSYPVLVNVLSKYQDGKEVYEIKCSIADYYDTDGNLIISPNDSSLLATFEMHTIVEPYVFTSSGEVPLSTKADGTPKQFEIIGIDYSYSGVVWQKLIIQESK